MLWDTVNAENNDVAMDCTSFQLPRRNTTTTRIGGSGVGSSSSSSSNIRRLNMDLDLSGGGGVVKNAASPTSAAALHDMSIDELSFYDDDNMSAMQREYIGSPAPLVGLLSPEGSPRRFQIIERSIGGGSNTNNNGNNNNNNTLSGSSTTTTGFLHFGRQQKLQLSNAINRSTTTQQTSTITSTTATTTATTTTNGLGGGKNFRTFHSLSSSGSMESASMDDDYMELLEMESLEQLQDDCSQSRLNFPSDLNSLISGAIKSVTPPTLIVPPPRTSNLDEMATPELMRRPSVRRCLSMTENSYNSPYLSTLQPKTPELLKQVQETATTPFSSRLTTTTTTSSAERGSPSCNSKLNNGHSTNTTTTTAASAAYCFKRPDPPSITNSPVHIKRYRSTEEKENMHMFCKSATTTTMTSSMAVSGYGSGGIGIGGGGGGGGGGVPLRKCMSMNDAEIMTALARSDNKDEPDLIGDFSKPFALPLMEGRHRDLKSISSETVARLLHGDFDDEVAKYMIIDCRYPYEYEGGHIRGAKNLYTQEQIIEEFLTQQKTEQLNACNKTSGQRRNIIIFHCEFSSERGPKLSRFLRNNDRARNTNAYPTLDYPEIYLLHNGYKEFYETHAELCEPVSYRPMLEPSYTEAYRHFRSKSKSWNGDVGCGTASRFKKSRSRLML